MEFLGRLTGGAVEQGLEGGLRGAVGVGVAHHPAGVRLA
jgi:hypothetical protein